MAFGGGHYSSGNGVFLTGDMDDMTWDTSSFGDISVNNCTITTSNTYTTGTFNVQWTSSGTNGIIYYPWGEKEEDLPSPELDLAAEVVLFFKNLQDNPLSPELILRWKDLRRWLEKVLDMADLFIPMIEAEIDKQVS